MVRKFIFLLQNCHLFLLIDIDCLCVGDKPFKAFEQVVAERPLAAVQIIGFIFAAEALGQFNQVKDGAAPGDLGFDPLGLKPSDLETWEKVQLRELKNGRLAMLAIAGKHIHFNIVQRQINSISTPHHRLAFVPLIHSYCNYMEFYHVLPF